MTEIKQIVFGGIRFGCGLRPTKKSRVQLWNSAHEKHVWGGLQRNSLISLIRDELNRAIYAQSKIGWGNLDVKLPYGIIVGNNILKLS